MTLYDPGIRPQTLFVRGRDERPRAVDALAAAVRSLSASSRLGSVRPLRDLVDDETRSRRTAAHLFGLFSVMAVVLAGGGAHAVVSAAVRRRTREMGIRVAMGATPWQVVRMVLGEGAGPLLAGWLLGATASVAAAPVLGHLLFGVDAGDPVSLAAASLTLGLAVLAGCLGPTARALRADPAVTLRDL